MTRPRPAGSRVRHGSGTCAVYGCTRPECVRAYRIDRARYERDRMNGIRATVPTAPTRRHIHRLLLAGVSLKDIARRSGVDETTVARANRGAHDLIHRVTADAILGVAVPTAPRTPVHRGWVTAIGSRRRLQALAAVGFTVAHIGAHAGVDAHNLGAIRRGARPRINITTHQAIARAYDELWDGDPIAAGVPAGNAQNTRLLAVRNGWLRPADLDDDCIDWDDEVAA